MRVPAILSAMVLSLSANAACAGGSVTAVYLDAMPRNYAMTPGAAGLVRGTASLYGVNQGGYQRPTTAASGVQNGGQQGAAQVTGGIDPLGGQGAVANTQTQVLDRKAYADWPIIIAK